MASLPLITPSDCAVVLVDYQDTDEKELTTPYRK